MEVYDFDLYASLELEPSSSEAEIKRAYRRLALALHPDRNGGVESEAFLQLKTAYDVLSDADKRVNYDAYHESRQFARDRRPLSAREAAWLVDQQKKTWGVREIHPFAVCILCDSCPCPADGVCYACGMHFCQMCVRKPHCRDGCQPHYPVRNEAHLEERLKEEGAEKARERKLLAGPSLKWAMHDAEFRRQRDVYRERARRGADDELSQYYAWGQTKYTVHLAVWLPSDRAAADVTFEEVEPEDAAADGEDAVWVGGGAGQRMTVTPADLPPILRGVFAHGIDTSRAGEALTFESLHSMTFILPKARPGERWRRLFVGDADGARELPLGEAPHVVAEEQVDGFAPADHSRVAQRKETASEWQEVEVIVRIPEAAEREHVDARIAHNALEVSVDGWGRWRRRLNHRVLEWEDGHQSRAHVDPMNSTWILTRDGAGRRCVQFILAQWTEGASKMAIAEIEAQKAKNQWQLLVEDADPFQTFDLVEADMFLRAGAVFKQRSQLSQQAGKLVEELEREAEKRGALPSSVHSAPFAELWADDAIASGSERQIVTRDDDGAEVEEAAAWWARTEAEEAERWNGRVRAARQAAAERREEAARREAEAEAHARARGGARRGGGRAARERRRAQQKENRELAKRTLAAAAAEAAASGGGSGGGEQPTQPVVGRRLEEMMGAAEAREAAAAAARANPPPPKPILPAAAAATTAASRAARTAGLPEHVRAGVPEEQRPASPASPSAPPPPAPPPVARRRRRRARRTACRRQPRQERVLVRGRRRQREGERAARAGVRRARRRRAREGRGGGDVQRARLPPRGRRRRRRPHPGAAGARRPHRPRALRGEGSAVVATRRRLPREARAAAVDEAHRRVSAKWCKVWLCRGDFTREKPASTQPRDDSLAREATCGLCGRARTARGTASLHAVAHRDQGPFRCLESLPSKIVDGVERCAHCYKVRLGATKVSHAHWIHCPHATRRRYVPHWINTPPTMPPAATPPAAGRAAGRRADARRVKYSCSSSPSPPASRRASCSIQDSRGTFSAVVPLGCTPGQQLPVQVPVTNSPPPPATTPPAAPAAMQPPPQPPPLQPQAAPPAAAPPAAAPAGRCSAVRAAAAAAGARAAGREAPPPGGGRRRRGRRWPAAVRRRGGPPPGGGGCRPANSGGSRPAACHRPAAGAAAAPSAGGPPPAATPPAAIDNSGRASTTAPRSASAAHACEDFTEIDHCRHTFCLNCIGACKRRITSTLYRRAEIRSCAMKARCETATASRTTATSTIPIDSKRRRFGIAARVAAAEPASPCSRRATLIEIWLDACSWGRAIVEAADNAAATSRRATAPPYGGDAHRRRRRLDAARDDVGPPPRAVSATAGPHGRQHEEEEEDRSG